MNILVCDDNRAEADNLSSLLQELRSNIIVNTFYNGQDVLDFLKKGVLVDCCILDIIMPDMTGLELAKSLRNIGYSGEIVFLSVSREYGPETYEVKAFSYLLKPLVSQSVDKMLTELEFLKNNADKHGIMVKTSGVTRIIQFNSISHAEVKDHKIFFRLNAGGDVEVYAKFSELAQKLLADSRFIQCHRSFIVNMQCIETISKNEIITHGGVKIPISRSFRGIDNFFIKWKSANGL